jgi:hypothetical protein
MAVVAVGSMDGVAVGAIVSVGTGVRVAVGVAVMSSLAWLWAWPWARLSGLDSARHVYTGHHLGAGRVGHAQPRV